MFFDSIRSVIAVTLLSVVVVAVALMFAQTGIVNAQTSCTGANNTPQCQSCEGAGGTFTGTGADGGCDSNAANPSPNLFTGSNNIFGNVINILTFVVGAISVLMLIIGGIRYVVSAGDAQAVTNAKNTILYAIVGIVIAFAARAIVFFVIDRI